MGRQDDDLAMEPWYWRDWRASHARSVFTSQDSPLGRLAGWCYRELLDAHWADPTCSLPDDDDELAALAGVSRSEWLSVRDVVVRWMPPNRRGRLQNRRALHEWKKAHGLRDVKREKAQAAAKVRWDKDKRRNSSPSLSNADAMQTHSGRNASGMPVEGMPAVTDAVAVAVAVPDARGDNDPPSPPQAGGALRLLVTTAEALGLPHGRAEVRAWRDALRGKASLEGLRDALHAEAERRRERTAGQGQGEAAASWAEEHGGHEAVCEQLLDWRALHQRPGEEAHQANERWRVAVGAPVGIVAAIGVALHHARRRRAAEAEAAARRPEPPSPEPDDPDDFDVPEDPAHASRQP